MATQIKLRRDTAANWLLEDPVLGQGEPGFETTTGKLKIGDGTSLWSALDYIVAEPDGSIDLSSVDQHIVPATDNLYDLGTPAKRWRHVYAADGSIYIGDIKLSNSSGTLVVQQVTNAGDISEAPVANPGVVTTDRIINGEHSFSINSSGALQLDGAPFTGGSTSLPINSLGYLYNDGTGTLSWTSGAGGGGGTTYDQSLNTTDSVTFNEITSTILWQNSSTTRSPNSVNVPGATPTVVFATPNWFTSIKLVIAVEGRLDGDGTNVDHTQTCEATIAATYNTAAEPIMSVYGIVYTSPTPLATFTVARNGLTGQIEVTAVNSQTTNAMNVRVQALQFVSRYD